MEAEQQASHPSDDSKSELRLLTQRGDTCDEADSPHITSRRDTAQAALCRQQAAGRVSDRVVNALLRSPLTLQLVDLVVLVTKADHNDLLLRLGDMLEHKSATVVLAGFVALQAMHRILEDYAPAYPLCGSIAEGVSSHHHPVGTSASWSAVVNSPAPW